jgi:hypothetical protein
MVRGSTDWTNPLLVMETHPTVLSVTMTDQSMSALAKSLEIGGLGVGPILPSFFFP